MFDDLPTTSTIRQYDVNKAGDKFFLTINELLYFSEDGSKNERYNLDDSDDDSLESTFRFAKKMKVIGDNFYLIDDFGQLKIIEINTE